MITLMFIALIAVVAIASIFLKEYKKTTRVLRVLAIIMILIGASREVYNYSQNKQKEKKSALSGMLETPQETEKANIGKSKRIKLLLGSSSLSISTPDLSAGRLIQPFKFLAFDYPMSVRLTENNIFISINVNSLVLQPYLIYGEWL